MTKLKRDARERRPEAAGESAAAVEKRPPVAVDEDERQVGSSPVRPPKTPDHSRPSSSPEPSGGVKKPKITRTALQKHLLLVQAKKRKGLTLRQRILVQEEFESMFVRLNSPDSSSESEDDEGDESGDECPSPKYRFLRRSRPSMMRPRRASQR
ncbi:hypothetical protein M3Y99_01589900 [Aphelenchoides fujianensis]|nr:hypothetical protein M3Y99_01589900 [Aphelenchoides fujianensis]